MASFPEGERLPAELQPTRVLNRYTVEHKAILEQHECIGAGPEGRFFPEHFYRRYCDGKQPKEK
eukprot:7617135-Alexandrium_andersonii.AAC.1